MARDVRRSDKPRGGSGDVTSGVTGVVSSAFIGVNLEIFPNCGGHPHCTSTDLAAVPSVRATSGGTGSAPYPTPLRRPWGRGAARPPRRAPVRWDIARPPEEEEPLSWHGQTGGSRRTVRALLTRLGGRGPHAAQRAKSEPKGWRPRRTRRHFALGRTLEGPRARWRGGQLEGVGRFGRRGRCIDCCGKTDQNGGFDCAECSPCLQRGRENEPQCASSAGSPVSVWLTPLLPSSTPKGTTRRRCRPVAEGRRKRTCIRCARGASVARVWAEERKYGIRWV